MTALPPTPFEEAFEKKYDHRDHDFGVATWAYAFGKKEAFREAAEEAENNGAEFEYMGYIHADRLREMEKEIK